VSRPVFSQQLSLLSVLSPTRDSRKTRAMSPTISCAVSLPSLKAAQMELPRRALQPPRSLFAHCYPYQYPMVPQSHLQPRHGSCRNHRAAVAPGASAPPITPGASNHILSPLSQRRIARSMVPTTDLHRTSSTPAGRSRPIPGRYSRFPLESQPHCRYSCCHRGRI